MVAKTMRCWLIMCVILCSSLMIWNSSQAAELLLHLQQHQIELGQVINAKLIARDVNAELAEIDLGTLYDDFAVIVSENVRGSSQTKLQTLNLELYPRRIGTLTIPSLVLGDLKSPQQTVIIGNAMVGETAMVVDLRISAQQVWQRQQILATVEIKSAHRFFSVDAEPFKMSGFEVRPFVTAREPIDGDPNYRSRIRLGWAIFPLISGPFTLELPMLRYEQGGLTQRQFFLPRINIQVRGLPAYIPANMPVAKVHVASSIVTNGLLLTGHLAYWNITLSANDTLAYWLPPVLHSIRPTNQIEYLPVKSRPSSQIDARGVLAQVTHEVPFKAQHIGTVDLPQLKVQYFDPDTGRIENIYHNTPPPMAWNAPVIVLVTVILIALLAWGVRWFIRQYTHHKQRQSAISAICDAHTAKEIFFGLRCYAAAEGWPANMTLSDFQRFWEQRYHVPKELSELLRCLSEQLYGGSVASLEKLQTGLLQQLRQPRRRRLSSQQPQNSVWESKKIFIKQ